MDTSFLTPGGPSRSKQVQDANDMFETIKRNAEKSGTPPPPYEFIELIGKGAFGRVYKCRHSITGQLVAVKIVNIDDADFEADPRERDETVKDFRKEVEILTQLKDYKAKNVNRIHDAFDLHSQLWIVSDFCTGGSIRTLMRANPKRGLEEQFLVPIARELAIAMKNVHEIGVIHRDIKCANVYVTEDGNIQLGDFGVVGVMDNGVAKRTTIIGTPWYMPKEMHVDTMSVEQGYGKEVDVWAYGCTIFEMATGHAPNSAVAQHMLGTVLEQKAPRLSGDDYTGDLKDFVSFCLNSDPQARPSADQILKHPYIAGTKISHPTQGLVALIDRYIMWEHRGGQRTSLFNPGGAAAPVRREDEEEQDVDTDDWNFNTSDSFFGGFAKRYSQMITEDLGPQFEAPPGAGLPPGAAVLPPLRTKLTPAEQIKRDHAQKSESRGERSLDRIWNQAARPYDSHSNTLLEPTSDLPLREYSSDSAPRESTVFIDLDVTPSGEEGPTFNFDFDNIVTVKAKQRGSVVEEEYTSEDRDPVGERESALAWSFPAKAETQPKRATMEWSWPGEPVTAPLEQELTVDTSESTLGAAFRPQLKHTMTAPLGQFGDFVHSGPLIGAGSPSRESVLSMIDLDVDIPRPSTAVSHTGSTSTTMTTGPFDLDERSSEVQEMDQRVSVHKLWQSEGGNSGRSSLRHVPMHYRGSSLSDTDSEFGRLSHVRGKSDSSTADYLDDMDLEGFLDNPVADGSKSASESGSTWLMVDNDDTAHSRVPSNVEDFKFPPTNGQKDTIRASGMSMLQSYHEQPLEAVDFPFLQAPNPNVLFDTADEQLVLVELRRLLQDAGNAFRGTALAIQRHTDLELGNIAPEDHRLEVGDTAAYTPQLNGVEGKI